MNYQELVEFIEAHNTSPDSMIDSMDHAIDKPRSRNIDDCAKQAIKTFARLDQATEFNNELRDYIEGMEQAQ
jgi:CHASE3 domain sensor protein